MKKREYGKTPKPIQESYPVRILRKHYEQGLQEYQRLMKMKQSPNGHEDKNVENWHRRMNRAINNDMNEIKLKLDSIKESINLLKSLDDIKQIK